MVPPPGPTSPTLQSDFPLSPQTNCFLNGTSVDSLGSGGVCIGVGDSLGVCVGCVEGVGDEVEVQLGDGVEYGDSLNVKFIGKDTVSSLREHVGFICRT
jgi:hypothetical protein